MDEKNEIIKRLKELGITYWEENVQVMFENISVCEPNSNLELLNNKCAGSLEYHQESDDYARIY